MANKLKIGDVIALDGEFVYFDAARSTGAAPAGEYVVLATAFDGGGTGHGPHDIYPDGHHVFCQKLNAAGTFDLEGLKISFYQSGSFTTLIKDIAPIRQMTMTFV